MKMNVLSLFDGISAGRLALQRAGIEVENYYASEIDKYAIKISEKNFPDIVRLGDVTKWESWDLPKIDLLIGGSPCQDLSIAKGNREGLGGKRSSLFWEYVAVKNDKNPKFFLFENVARMPKKDMDIITKELGVEPIKINSSRLSAQNRERLYWTNVKVEQPDDLGIVLADIIEEGVVDRDNSYCIDANYFKGGNPKSYFESGRRQLVFQSQEGLAHFNSLIRMGTATNIGGLEHQKRVYSVAGKSPTVSTMGGGNLEPKVAYDELVYRSLTPLECERLQTFPDGYTDTVSKTQRYKSLGNSWTVDVIAHIFRCMFMEECDCGYLFDQSGVGKYGCPNCEGSGKSA